MMIQRAAVAGTFTIFIPANLKRWIGKREKEKEETKHKNTEKKRKKK